MPTSAEILENMLVVVQTGSTDRARLLEASRMERQLRDRGEPYAVLVYLSAETALPDDGDRKAISALMKQTSQNATAMGVVLDGTGFFAAAMRGAGVAISAVSGVPMPFHRSVDDALVDLAAALEGDVPADAAVKEIIARHLSAEGG